MSFFKHDLILTDETNSKLGVLIELLKLVLLKLGYKSRTRMHEKILQLMIKGITLNRSRVKDEKILRSPSLLKAINLAKKMIKGEGRVLIRKSGTEAKIRIMAESENIDLIKKCIHIVKKEIK